MTNPIHTIPSAIRDNRQRGSVGDFLLAKIGSGSELSVVSAYFTIYAYAALKDNLDLIKGMRFLFGEPRFVKSLDPEKTDKKSFNIEDGELHLNNRLEQRRAARECADWIQQKVDIKSIKQANLLHGKLYHIEQGGQVNAILGSSNFTVSGLGMASSGNNIELNMVVDSGRDLEDLKAWFEELWNNEDLVEDVKVKVLAYLGQLYRDNSPEFIYFKTLYHIFEDVLGKDAQKRLDAIQKQIVDTEIWKYLYEFQKEGVKGAINKILTYNGCILADSVGLGKTFEALAIIKYFELRNERVLVLCPKKLRENWTVHLAAVGSSLNLFARDRFDYTVLSHTDLSRTSGRSGIVDLANFHWNGYGLVVIDESHNFRNNTPSKRDENNELIRPSRYERLMQDIIQKGGNTKVLLLSATPVNNTLRDLRNQIHLITRGEDHAFAQTLGISDLTDTLAVAQRIFTGWAKNNTERRTKDLLAQFNPAFFKLLDGLTIARSRKHVTNFYQQLIPGGFPTRLPPHSLYPEIDLQGEFMSYDGLNDLIDQYKLSLFNPSFYVKPEFRSLYETSKVAQFTQAKRESYLIGMMKVNFLKRLESSVHSFDLTLQRTIQKIDDLKSRIQRFQEFQAQNPDFEWEDLQVEDADDEDLQNALELFQVSKARFKLAHMDVEAWAADLKRDRDQLHVLELMAREITFERDAKLLELRKLIEEKVRHPNTDKQGGLNRKLLVFTAFADTALYLFNVLKDWARQDLGIHVALVSGGAVENQTTLGRKDFNHILTNFSPISKQRALMPSLPQTGEIDLLIATDCISEGQNLQDCDTLVNYDIHWNPVRVIQRFGRIDRIGSINTAIQLVNFWPTKDLDKYIALKTRVEARMALVDIAATLDDNLLNPGEIEDLITDDLKYRDRQLLRLRNEVLDLDDFNEGLSLPDFSLDDFRAELSRFLKANEDLLKDAPFGLYAVVPPDPEQPFIRPGVVFCLRQKGNPPSDSVNPLQPYFLVYFLEDDVVRFNFTQPKQTLELMRDLCAGKSQAYEDLCQAFNTQINHGQDMSFYDDLLRKTVRAIESHFRKRAAGRLVEGRGALIPSLQDQVNEQTEFELITWLVIRDR